MKQILWIIPFGIVFWLLNANLAPSGKLEAVYDFHTPSPYISELRPGGRLTPIQDGTQTIIDDPVFFSVRPPSQFEKVSVELTYQNSGAPIIELGAQRGPNDWQLDMRPVEVAAIEQSSWPRIRDYGELLLAKDPRATSVNDYIRTLQQSAKLVTYRHQLFRPTSNARATRDDTALGIRGRHTVFFGAVPAEPSFTIHEVNRNLGADDIIMTIPDGPKILSDWKWHDDGIVDGRGATSTARSLRLQNFPRLRAPIRLDVDASDDVVFDTLQAYRGPLVFGKRLYLADGAFVSGPRTVYVRGSYLRARTSHETGRQTLVVGAAQLDIPIKDAWVRTALPEKLVPVVVPVHDVLLETDGYFALSADQFFEPEYPTLGPETDITKFDAILANYRSPESRDGWRVARAEFAMPLLYHRPDGHRFVISAPGIKLAGGEVVVKQIKVTWSRPPESFVKRLFRSFKVIPSLLEGR